MNFFEKNNKVIFNLIFQKNNLICLLIVSVIFFLDRISKIRIINHQIENNSIYINDFINFDLVWNTGIGFGFFHSSSSFIYNSLTAIIGTIIILIVYFVIKSNSVEKVSLTAILGGAIGNFYDRLVYFAVPDFIDFHYGNFHWFTFNIADIFITLGIFSLIINDLTKKNEKY